MLLLNKIKPYDKNENHKWPQLVVTIAVCCSSISSGLAGGWTSPTIPKLTSNSSAIPMTFEETSWFTILHPAGSLLCPLLIYIGNHIGRKKSLLLITAPHCISWFIVAFSETTTPLYISRFICGIGNSALFTFLPIYLGEIMEPSVRGKYSCILMISLYFGQVLINAIGYYIGIKETAVISVILSVLFFLFILPIPESPYDLLMQNREREAEESLKCLRWRENVKGEISQIRVDIIRQLTESGNILDLFRIKSNFKALIICMEIRLCQQLSGIVPFIFYSQTIFKEVGGNFHETTATLIFLSLIAVVSSFGALSIDKFGRRILYIGSSLESGTALLVTCLYFYFKDFTTIDVSSYSWISLLGMLCYVFGAGMGLNIVPTILLGELFPASIKEKALCLMTCFFSLSVMLANKIFHILEYF